MPFTPDEEELYLWLRTSLPRWFFQSDDAAEEIWGAVVKGLQPLRDQMDSWVDATFIDNAESIWLNQHARDRGTFRQASESDATLRARLKEVEDTVTLPAVRKAINRVLLAAGLRATIQVPRAGWRMSWVVENNCSGIVTIPQGDYTLIELMTEMQTQFFNPVAPTGDERLMIYELAPGEIEIGGSLSVDNISVTWIDTDFRDALGYTADMSGDVVATAPLGADGDQPCHIVELRSDRAFFRVYTPANGTGDDLTAVGDYLVLEDAAVTFAGSEIPRSTAYYWIEPHRTRTLEIAGPTSPANASSAGSVVAMDDHSVTIPAPGGVTEVFPGTWTLDPGSDNRKMAFLSRGYRMTRQFTADPNVAEYPYTGGSAFIVILPYGTTAATALGVTEALRQRKAGGVVHYVERRANP